VPHRNKAVQEILERIDILAKDTHVSAQVRKELLEDIQDHLTVVVYRASEDAHEEAANGEYRPDEVGGEA
jgi:3-dehydroquinate dehydratase